MKTMIKLPVILLGLMLLLTGTAQKVAAQNEEVSLQSFYDELSPYGQWINDPQYGYVWRPDVDQDEFRPYYTNGRWVMTEYGNTWVSNYDWGWAPFHYGRWVHNRYNNWVWIPDTVWGPAWVSWRSGGGYYGWAPLGPSISIGINIGRGGYRIPDMCWNFVPYNNIYYNSYPRYYGNRNRVYIQNTVIINNTYVRNNRTYYTGPRAEDIRRRTNQNVTVYNVNRSNRPGANRIDNNTVNIYNPRPSRGTDNSAAAPRNAVNGSINRGVISRDNSVSAGRGTRENSYGNPTRDGREVSSNSRPQQERSSGGMINQSNERNGNMGTRPTRERNAVGDVQPSRPMDNSERRADQSNRERVDRSSQPQQRMDRPQQQERSERMQQQSQPAPRRMESRPQPQQQAPQRTERAERSQPQRVERSQSAPQRSSGGSGNESRGGRSNEGGGRTRGGN
ncbi:MAG: hypothetical protein EOO90_10530 [Pedobacter sp.]|nr:MAG: hypothetical protein EOO90_10530 [Pedobacter sp.]